MVSNNRYLMHLYVYYNIQNCVFGIFKNYPKSITESTLYAPIHTLHILFLGAIVYVACLVQFYNVQ